MKKAFLILASVLFLAVSTAQAEGEAYLPNFDTNAYCKQVATFSGGSSQIELGCRQNEKNAAQSLLQMTMYPEVLNYCTQVAIASGQSYSILYGCVQNEMNARKALEVQ